MESRSIENRPRKGEPDKNYPRRVTVRVCLLGTCRDRAVYLGTTRLEVARTHQSRKCPESWRTRLDLGDAHNQKTIVMGANSERALKGGEVSLKLRISQKPSL